MASIRCGSCGFVVGSDDHNHLKLMDDIHKWINYVLSVHLERGETAAHLNSSAHCPACPRCGKTGAWENVTA